MATSNNVGVLIYDQVRTTTDITDAGKQFDVSGEANPLTLAQIKIAVDPAGSPISTVTVYVEGRLDPNAAWDVLTKSDYSTASSVAQVSGAAVDVIMPVLRMPYMRIRHTGGGTGYAATVGNRIRCWILGKGKGLVTAS